VYIPWLVGEKGNRYDEKGGASEIGFRGDRCHAEGQKKTPDKDFPVKESPIVPWGATQEKRWEKKED